MSSQLANDLLKQCHRYYDYKAAKEKRKTKNKTKIKNDRLMRENETTQLLCESKNREHFDLISHCAATSQKRDETTN